MRTSLTAIAKKAREEPGHRFGNLYGCLDKELLTESLRRLKAGKASGIDAVSLEEYRAKADANLTSLAERLKEKRYRPAHVRRVMIPKAGGGSRPLGLPTVEDKVVQKAASQVLEAIYEEDFCAESYGYRPMRSVKEALDDLIRQLRSQGLRWVVEVDIRGFFDNLEHGWMLRMLEQRMDDGACLELVRKWLKAGVVQSDGSLTLPRAGTPQGGVISPLLANVYLHYALDLWFGRVFARSCHGRSALSRYADDFVAAFSEREDAERFLAEVKERLAKFGLEVAGEKTRLVEFTPRARTRFEFLGFEMRWCHRRGGRWWIARRTAMKKFNAALQRFKEWVRGHRHRRVSWLNAKLTLWARGYRNHYEAPGNGRRLQAFFYKALRILYEWLNRRSGRRSYTWEAFNMLLRGAMAPMMAAMKMKAAYV